MNIKKYSIMRKKAPNGLPSEYLLEEQVLDSPRVSIEKNEKLSSSMSGKITNYAFLEMTRKKKHTLVLSRMTNNRVVFRGLNNRIITFKQIK